MRGRGRGGPGRGGLPGRGVGSFAAPSLNALQAQAAAGLILSALAGNPANQESFTGG
ncbi:unnamed protein product, partial [Heterosigma akashiwo]